MPHQKKTHTDIGKMVDKKYKSNFISLKLIEDATSYPLALYIILDIYCNVRDVTDEHTNYSNSN